LPTSGQLGEFLVTENHVCQSILRGLVGSTILVISGCGGAAPQPKADLNEQEKQQVRELNQQRMDEWGKKK
jgi:hypothetical protein